MARVRDPLERVGLGDAAASLRAQWRADEEEWTCAAVERWQHDRTFVDVLRACMHRGDTVALELPHTTFRGVVGAVGDDFVSLHASGGAVEVRLDVVAPPLRVLEDARAGGTRGVAVTTFRARLLELEMERVTVEVGTEPAGALLRGRLRVGRDHVVVDDFDGAQAVVVWSALAWVRAIVADD
jgi:hypothetical protein